LPSPGTETVGGEQLTEFLKAAAASFAQDELAYLALTSKIERPLQDRLAWCLHTRLPGLVVSREWKATDIAVLSADAESPLMMLEAKAMYSFDVAWKCRAGALAYPRMMQQDIVKARALDRHGTADVYALGLVTHPHGRPRNLPGVIKYLDRINRALDAASPEDLQLMSAATMQQALSPFGQVRSGDLPGRNAFGVEVTIGYWLVGPARQAAPGLADADTGCQRLSHRLGTPPP
jgi:hypothetical protein